ncbi:hypothetical protein CROQUDRAFT_670130 [Cronartium quercuum f. sp. fusiforme G11]|uniref:Uncharacterized protein n=1 Tax=Cronartium quercuum f. sp. fusiforme G11 TaxID=708437 RepID=A0A9P6TD43_9BASI|nr:hypothetical protein CROQUDRAFT_670130 [Cronartium quercuum f. sp. fusiforme G11]
MSWWRIHGAWLLLITLTGEFITSILTTIPMVRHLARAQKLWAISRPRLDAIVRHAVSPNGITPSPNNFKFENNTLLILLDLKKHGDLFLLNLRRFASGFFSFTLLTAFMFFYASITILLALNTQLKLIEEVLRKASRARSPTGQPIDPSYISQSMLKRTQTKVFEIRKLLTWKTFFDFLRKEELDYTFDTASIDQHCLIEHESKLLKKASRLRRHWWRIFLQSIIVAALTMSYCTLAFTVAANVWGLGDEHFVTQIEHIVDAWKIWTWVSGPGIMLAAITCVSEFLEEAKDEPEPCVVKPKLKERSPEGSFIPTSTRESSSIEGVNRLLLKIGRPKN